MSNIKISPSILSANFAILKDEIISLEQSGADYIHLDIMDGSFVPNITFGSKLIKDIRPHTTLPLDCHLMIRNPEKHIEDIAKAGANIITFHCEATNHIDSLIDKIKSFGCMAGLALCPSTNENILDYVIDKLDLILIMTVNPGFGGQKFIHSQLTKIQNVRSKIDQTNSNILLEVDGGINYETSGLVKDAGANMLVSGSYIFSGYIEENIRKLK